MIYILRPSIKYCTVLIWGTVPYVCQAQTSVSDGQGAIVTQISHVTPYLILTRK